MQVVGRLAPTPSGALHLGNVTAFLAAWLSARSAGGRVLLRIEDVDGSRARADVAEGQRRDLDWLGLAWDEEVTPQSRRDYAPWLGALGDAVYRCVCTRREVAAAGGVYPGTCRDAGHTQGKLRFRLPEGAIDFVDRRRGPISVDLAMLGDPVLQQADGTFAYNLAVVADDLADGVTEVVRGADLLEQTAAQVRLWEAFGATPPTWLHAPLILGPDGRKLSKSHGAHHVGALRDAGWTAERVRAIALSWLGLPPLSLDDAARAFRVERISPGPIRDATR